MPELTNPRAERVKAVRALAGRSARARHGQFLAEGPQAAREAVRSHGSGFSVRDLYVTDAAAQRHPEIPAEATAAGIRVHTASPEVLEAMSGDAQGVLAVVAGSARSLADVLAGGPQLVAVLAHVRDPGNAGAVIRAADSAGAAAVVVTSESVDVHGPKVVRSTAGSLFHVPVVTGVPLSEVLSSLRAAGLTVLATDAAGAHDLDDLQDEAADARRTSPQGGVGRSDAAISSGARAHDRATPDLCAPTAWLFGNEAWGLSQADRDGADAVVRVPIHGRAESLNLATAAAVCLYASARAQR